MDNSFVIFVFCFAGMCNAEYNNFNFTTFYEEFTDQEIWVNGLPHLNITGKATISTGFPESRSFGPRLQLSIQGSTTLSAPDALFVSDDCKKITDNSATYEMMLISCSWESVSNMILIDVSLPKLNSSFNHSIFYYQYGGERTNTFQILVSDCPVLEASGPPLSISGGENAVFMDRAVYTCTKNNASITTDGKMLPIAVPYVRVCQETASWNGTNNVTCSYRPEPVISTSSTSNSSWDGNQYYEDDEINLNCEDDGNPPITHTKFTLTYWNGSVKNVPSPLNIEWDFNGANLSCYAGNDFTNTFRLPDSKSINSIMMGVRFAPRAANTGITKTIAAVGESISLIFDFFTNPYVRQNNLIMIFTDGNSTVNISAEKLMLTNDKGSSPYEMAQSCTYTIPKVTLNNYGLYNLVAFSEDERFHDKPLNMTIALVEIATTPTPVISSTTGSSPVPLPAVIGGSLAAFLVVILIIGYAIIRRRKNKYQKNGTAVKEERNNPIYGTSVGASGVEFDALDKRGSKEERENPLYASNAMSPVEEAYAAVDTRKKKKNTNKGNDNVAFSTENSAAVYAAVNKPKKKKTGISPVEDIYTEVNKKNK